MVQHLAHQEGTGHSSIPPTQSSSESHVGALDWLVVSSPSCGCSARTPTRTGLKQALFRVQNIYSCLGRGVGGEGEEEKSIMAHALLLCPILNGPQPIT